MRLLIQRVLELNVRDKRELFWLIRSGKVDEHDFVPRFAMTIGDFAVGNVVLKK